MLNRQTIVLSFFSLMIGMNNISFAQQTEVDGDWTKNYVSLKNTKEAEYMIRVGDIDNLNFLWPENFNPFCGTSTPAHSFPWDINPNDVPGTDRILLGTSFKGENGADGYSGSYSDATKPVPISIDLKDIKQMKINKVTMQIFLDDFQSPVIGSRFTTTLNGRRLYEFEKILHSLNQTGPIGKLVTIDIPNDILPEFSTGKVDLIIDDPSTGMGDGYAIDFIKFLINPKNVAVYKGNLTGIVLDEDNAPIANAFVKVSNSKSTKTNSEGKFEYKDISPGLHIVNVYKRGYVNANQNVDIECNNLAEVEIKLNKASFIKFNGREITEGDTIVNNKIQFPVNGSDLSDADKQELDKIYQLMTENVQMEIDLSGFTSSEGEAIFNKKLSLSRVDACKNYLVQKGISANRIFTIGMGADNPIAPNDTEVNRNKNRRVEIKIVKIQNN